MLIHSPKTEGHEGGKSRYVPIFPEVAPLLQQAFDEAEPGTKYVITRYRQRGCNLRTQFTRILAKAGLKPWPKLMQNLRSSRQTELAETYPLHLICAWLGNSRLIAQRHYLQIRDQDFMEAAGHAARDGTGPEIQCASNWTEQAQANTSEGESTNPTDPTEGTKNEGELAYANACGPLKRTSGRYRT